MKRITSQESLLLEYSALLDAINKSISNLAQYRHVRDGAQDTVVTEKLNRLKLHRKRLESMLGYCKHAAADEWMHIRDKAKRIFREARTEFVKPALN